MTTEDESIIGAGNSTNDTSEKRRRIEDSKTSVLMAVPENTSIVLKGSQEIAGNIMIQNGRKTVKIASAVRRTYRESKKAKEFRVLTEEEKGGVVLNSPYQITRMLSKSGMTFTGTAKYALCKIKVNGRLIRQ